MPSFSLLTNWFISESCFRLLSVFLCVLQRSPHPCVSEHKPHRTGVPRPDPLSTAAQPPAAVFPASHIIPVFFLTCLIRKRGWIGGADGEYPHSLPFCPLRRREAGREAGRTQPRTRGQLSHQLCLSETHIQRSLGAWQPQGGGLTAPCMAPRLRPAHPAGRRGFQGLGVVLWWLLPRRSQPRETKPGGRGGKDSPSLLAFQGVKIPAGTALPTLWAKPQPARPTPLPCRGG